MNDCGARGRAYGQRLSDEDVAFIREAYASPYRGLGKELAQRFAVTTGHISSVASGRERLPRDGSPVAPIPPTRRTLSDEDVAAIRKAYELPRRGLRNELAAKYGVSPVYLSQVARGCVRNG